MLDVTNSWALDGGTVVRLLGAALLGGLVGLERESSEQQAGLRTHIAVALGAALFGAVSTLGFQEFDRPRGETTIQADVSRVASNVAVGIGFLGAGLIFRQGNIVRNLTTGASLWTVAAIGLAAGVGDLTMAAIATAVLLVSLVLLRPIRTLIRQHFSDGTTDVTVTLEHGASVSEVMATLDELEVDLAQLEVTRGREGIELALRLRCDPGRSVQVVRAMAAQPRVTHVADAGAVP